KSCTNSSRSAGVRCCQCGPSARRAVSWTSNASMASLRTAARRSCRRSSAFRAGSSRTFCTASVYSRRVSVGAPAQAGLRSAVTSAEPERILTPKALTLLIREAPSRLSIQCAYPLDPEGRFRATSVHAFALRRGGAHALPPGRPGTRRLHELAVPRWFREGSLGALRVALGLFTLLVVTLPAFAQQ